MKKRIVQEDFFGCAVACLAMAVGVDYKTMRKEVGRYWAAVHPFDRYDGLDHKDEEIILYIFGYRLLGARAIKGRDLRSYVGNLPAILTVPSLNVMEHFHAVYWDGKKVHDPSPLKVYSTAAAWKSAISAGVVSRLSCANRYPLRGIDGKRIIDGNA